MSDPWAETTDETVALLLEEVARLEAELRDRDQAAHALESSRNDPARPEADAPDPAQGRLVAELTAELAGRDETISALLEQSELFEQTAAAQREEWERLHQWVEELEQRVEGKDDREATLQSDLAFSHRNHQADRNSFDSELRAWEARYRSLAHEAEGLRGALRGDEPGGESDAAVEFLKRENRELREAYVRLEHEASAAAEVAPLTERLNEALAELDDVKARLARALDEAERERNEYEATIGALKTKLAAASRPALTAPGSGAAMTEADERIRAFRDHLRELHKAEAARRSDRTLSSRLSRLWRSTGPG